MKIFKLIPLIIIMIACSKEAPTKNFKEVTPVEISQVKSINLKSTWQKSGIISKRKQTALSFKVGGYVEKLYVNEGDEIKKGQLLAKLNLTEISSMKKQAEIGLEKAIRDHRRIENLYKDSIATYQQYQDVKSALDLAEAQLNIATYNYSNARIIAPNSGKILRKVAAENQLIGPGNPVYFISDNSSKTIMKIGLSDRDLMRIRLNQKVAVTFNFTDKVFPGQVLELPAAANEKNGLFDVVINISNTGEFDLLTGMIGRVTFTDEQQSKKLVIPINAISSANRDMAEVFVLDNNLNIVHSKMIQIGEFTDEFVIINNGLVEGESIVTNGALFLFDGASISIQEQKQLFSSNKGDN